MTTTNFQQMYEYVIEHALIQIDYDQASDEQKAVYRVLQFYNEMASGGFEGFNGWILEQLQYEKPNDYIEKLAKNLRQVKCKEMAAVVEEQAWRVYLAAESYVEEELTEDDYIELLVEANEQYYELEETFHQKIEAYIVHLYSTMTIGKEGLV